jgi:hypothetical protein
MTDPSTVAGHLAGADFVRSPLTGWTRETWRVVADATLTAVRPYASPGHALVNLPGPVSFSGRHSDGLEGFARTFLLAGFRLAADSEPDPHHLAEWYAAGLAAGSDPGHAEHWPDMAGVNQAKVECASLAVALHETRRVIWDRLDDPVRQRLVEWMSGIAGTSVPPNNWLWFRAITAAFLRSVGAPHHAPDIEEAIARTEEWYVGDGWYSDGREPDGQLRGFDYYTGWAMHFYPLWYCRISGPLAPDELRLRYRQRLRRYLTDAQYLIGARGAPLLHGRSLTYRYAMLAPFWAGHLFDASPISPGRTRRLASGVLRHFISAGCFDENGLLPLGWHGRFPAIRQGYSGPGSPYWSSKGFAGLVLPADHPVWTQTEEPMATELEDVRLALPVPGWLVSSTRDDGVIRIAAHGADHAATTQPALDDEFYSRLGYSSHTAPLMTATSRATPVDSHAALVTADGRPSHRRPSHPVAVEGVVAVSRHRAHWPAGALPDRYDFDQTPAGWTVGPWLTTACVLRGAVEVRLCRIDPAPPDRRWAEEPGPLRLRLGGAAIADAHPPTRLGPDAGTGVSRADGLSSVLIGLRGLPDSGLDRHEDSNPLGRYCAVPWVASGAPVRAGEVYAAVAVLGAAPSRPADPELRVRHDADGARVDVRWPDGVTDVVRLDPPPAEIPGCPAAPATCERLETPR